MAKKEEKSNKHESDKENEGHSQKHDDHKLQNNGKEGETGKGHTSDAGLDKIAEVGKGKYDERGFRPDKSYGKEYQDERGFEKDNQAANENAGGLDLGNIGGTDLGNLGGTGLGNPDLSTSLGKLAKNMGCLSNFTGLFILLALVLIF